MGWAVGLRRREEPLLLLAAGAVLAGLTLLPLAFLGGELAKGEALRHAARALSAPRTWTLFLSSLGLASAVTVLSLAIGLPLGGLLGRADVPLRRVALGLHAFPLFVPPFLLALGWFDLVGRGGSGGRTWARGSSSPRRAPSSSSRSHLSSPRSSQWASRQSTRRSRGGAPGRGTAESRRADPAPAHPSRIFTLEANGPESAVAALSCVQVAITAAVIAVGTALLFRRRR